MALLALTLGACDLGGPKLERVTLSGRMTTAEVRALGHEPVEPVPDSLGVETTSMGSGWQCQEWFVTRSCLVNAQGESYDCIVTSVKCVWWAYVGVNDGGGGGEPLPEDDSCAPDPFTGAVPIFCGTGGLPPPPNPCQEPDPPAYCQNRCETSDPVLNNTGMQEAMDALMRASRPGAPMADRRERGGWVTRDAQTGALGLVRWPDAWSSACGIDPPPGMVPPPDAVAWIHTHPWNVGELKTACEPEMNLSQMSPAQRALIPPEQIYLRHESTPSSHDYNASAAFGVPGYVIDGNTIIRFGSTPASRVTHARCGYPELGNL